MRLFPGLAMSEEVLEILDWVQVVFLGGHQNAGQNIAHGGSDLIFEKQRIPPVSNRSLKRPFSLIVIDRR